MDIDIKQAIYDDETKEIFRKETELINQSIDFMNKYNIPMMQYIRKDMHEYFYNLFKETPVIFAYGLEKETHFIHIKKNNKEGYKGVILFDFKSAFERLIRARDE